MVPVVPNVECSPFLYGKDQHYGKQQQNETTRIIRDAIVRMQYDLFYVP